MDEMTLAPGIATTQFNGVVIPFCCKCGHLLHPSYVKDHHEICVADR